MKKIHVFLAAMALVMSSLSMRAFAQTPVSQDATCGQTVSISATPVAGYKFVQWQDGNTDNPRLIEVTADLNVYDYVATFAPAVYTVTVGVNNDEMGSVTGSGDYNFGESVQITATPSSKCYRFAQWSDGNTDNPRTITVGADDAANTYEAIFEQVTFQVNASSANASYGTVTISLVP